jgi:hypothetical protein
MYTSKFNFGVYVSFLLGILLLGLGIYIFSHPGILIRSKHSSKSISPAIPGIFVIISSLISVYPVVKRASIIYIEEDLIKIRFFSRSVILNAADIQSIELNARKYSSLFDAGYKISGIEIISTPGKKYFLPDKYFGSKAVLKQRLNYFCSSNKISLIEPVKKETKLKMIPAIAGEDKFSGNYLTSFNGIFLFVMIGFFCMIAKKNTQHAGYYFILFFIVVWYLIFSIAANYFVISGDIFLVRNHLLFWKKKAYDINSIRQVVFGRTRNSSYSLEIILEDYNSKQYYAGSLRDADWRALKNRLEESGIPVTSDLSGNLFTG